MLGTAAAVSGSLARGLRSNFRVSFDKRGTVIDSPFEVQALRSRGRVACISHRPFWMFANGTQFDVEILLRQRLAYGR
jgi:hypothetical protein